jgi:hypothetical protein
LRGGRKDSLIQRPGNERKLGTLKELKVTHKDSSTEWVGVSRKWEETGVVSRGSDHKELVSHPESLHLTQSANESNLRVT